MYRRADGIVDFDKSVCIGCKACIAACPYDAIFINPEDHSAEKCNFCAHRLDVGLEPACVVVCPTEAILVGDLNDPSSQVAQIVNREPVAVRRPEKDTRPKLSTRARTRRRSIRWPPGGRTAGSTRGRRSLEAGPGHVAARASGRGTAPAPRRCCPTTSLTRLRGIGASACTPGRKASRPGVFLVPLILLLAGGSRGQSAVAVGRPGAGGRSWL